MVFQVKEKQGKVWEFTINNYTDEDIEWVQNLDKVTAAMVCTKEICPTTGTPHLQGRVKFNGNQRFSGMKKKHAKWHFDLTIATKDWSYPVKVDSKVVVLSPPEKKQGVRTDLKNALDTIKRVKRKRELLDDEDIQPVIAKYARWVDIQYAHNHKFTEPFIPRPGWQEDIWKLVDSQADKRTINWYWSDKGDIGKTTLAKGIVDHKDGLVMPLSYTDGCYLYSDERVCIFNIPRKTDIPIPYGLMENLKDGMIVSTKYHTEMKRFPSPHIIVFANCLPDIEKLSADRWNIVEVA